MAAHLLKLADIALRTAGTCRWAPLNPNFTGGCPQTHVSVALAIGNDSLIPSSVLRHLHLHILWVFWGGGAGAEGYLKG